jgi:hypothetical protein
MRPTSALPLLLRLLRQPATSTVLALACCAAVGLSCAQGVGGTTTPTGGNGDNATGDDDDDDQNTGDDDNVNPDSGAFGQGDATGDDDDDDAPGREAGPEAGTDAGDAGDSGAKADTGAPDAAKDGGGSTAPVCPEMTSGTLIVVEIMIQSKSGNVGSDSGEWVELLNPSSTCAVELDSFTVSSPRGASADVAMLADGYRVGPGETVIVADSLSTASNNGLTGQIYTWNATDVLVNGGDSVSVMRGNTTLNTFTYTSDSVKVTDGASLEYPSDCSIKNVGTLSYWQTATTTYGTLTGCGPTGTSACMGTPNADNLDVAPTAGCE